MSTEVEQVIHDLLWGRKLIEPGTGRILANDSRAIARDVSAALRAANRLRESAVPDAAGVDAVLNRLDELNNYGISYEVYSELHDLVSAIPAAVPDAATERDLRSKLSRAYRQRDEEREAKKGNIRALNKALAERDAALAAIERCREVADALRTRYAENSDAAYFVRQVVAALDGGGSGE